jgi:hypothetical protein
VGINIKGHEDRRRYNPSRDIAYAWPNLMKAALIGFEKEKSEPITAYLIEQSGINDRDLGELVARYANYFQECLAQGDKNHKTPEDALVACGFFDLPSSHQAVLLARLGQIITGAFFYAIRDVHVDSEDPPFNDATIIRAGFEGKQAFINQGKWYRPFTNFFKKLVNKPKGSNDA